MDVKTKEATALVIPVDDDQSQHGEFEVILSTSALDRDGDELDPADWKQPLPEYITFDVDHGMSVEKTVGGGKPFITPSGQLQVRGQWASRPLAQDTRTLVKEGIIRNVSVAYMERKNADGKVERELLNGAFVAIPANTEAVVLSAKSAKAEQLADETALSVRISGGIDALRKALESADATFEIDEIEEKSLSESAAPDPAADAAGSAADEDIELAKAKALALAIQLS